MSTPLELGKKFYKRTDEEERCDKSIYQQAIGFPTYVSTATRPDIAVAVVTLSQFMSDPSKEHWMGVKRMLRYTKGTLSYGIKSVICMVFPMPIGQGMQTIDCLLPGMFSKSIIPQSVGAARSRLQSLKPLQRQNMLP